MRCARQRGRNDTMQKLFTLLLVFLSCASCEAQNFAQRADQYLNKYSREQFMGSVLVARAGKVLFTKSYGFADLENDVLNAPETKFNICSLTKQFTGLAVLQLAERGKLKLEDPVSKYYEQAPPAWEKITI